MAAKAALKKDTVLANAVETALSAVQHTARDFGVGEHLGYQVEGERLLTHFFACPHPGYVGWRWAVTMTRPPRARVATVNEVVLVPDSNALSVPRWVPWSERVLPGDVTPGSLLPTPDNDPRLEPGFTGGEMTADDDPAEWSETRAVVAEFGLGRERVLSLEGRADTAERWIKSGAGPRNATTEHAPGQCLTCGYFNRLQGVLGRTFGVCTNMYATRDGEVVSTNHGCGAHSDVVEEQRPAEIGQPVYDTLSIDQSLFD